MLTKCSLGTGVGQDYALPKHVQRRDAEAIRRRAGYLGCLTYGRKMRGGMALWLVVKGVSLRRKSEGVQKGFVVSAIYALGVFWCCNWSSRAFAG